MCKFEVSQFQAYTTITNKLPRWGGGSVNTLFGLQAGRAAFEPQHPHKTPGLVARVYDPSAREVEAEGALGLPRQPALPDQ